jgi:CRP-like cAMP-binding protein
MVNLMTVTSIMEDFTPAQKLLIDNVQKHISLDDDEKKIFLSSFKLNHIESGQFLIREGEVGQYESFVAQGCLKTYYENDNGVEHVLDFLIEGWWANDLYSFFTQTPSKSSIKAIEETDVLQISKNDLELLYQRIPKLERFFRLLFQNAFIAQRDQIKQILSASAEERYVQFVKQKPYALKRFPKKDIASYLGITPQFFSTLKKKIKPLNVD